jgi:hypothetical protein
VGVSGRSLGHGGGRGALKGIVGHGPFFPTLLLPSHKGCNFVPLRTTGRSNRTDLLCTEACKL